MEIQLLFIVLFAFNLFLSWLSKFIKQFGWYRFWSAFFMFIPLLMVVFEQPRFELDYFWWRIAGIIAIVAGAGIALWARIKFHAVGIKVGGTAAPQAMLTSGPYQFVRHPQYLGLVLIYVGWWWVWSAVYSFYFGMIILALIWVEAYLEERFILEKQFGNRYREYRYHTGMFWIK